MIVNYIGFHRFNSINSLKNQSFFWQFRLRPYFCTPIKREHSSVGLEHLVYTERVRGSNPCAPTKNPQHIKQIVGDFCFKAFRHF